MSQVNTLIQRLCPDGVRYATVSDVAKYVRGITYSKQDEQATGAVRVLRSNNITLSSNTLNFDDVKRVSSKVKVRTDQRLYKDDILISAASGSKAHVGKVAFIYEDIDYVFGGFMAVLRTNGGIMPRFLFHLLIGKSFSNYLESALSTTTINNLNATIIGGFKIPVPPIEVQREIVRILDTFSKLEAELEAELEARRKQYTFYRDQLLTFTERERERERRIRWVKMSELGLWYGGGTPSKSNPAYWTGGYIPWLTPKDMNSPVISDTEDHITEAAVRGSATKLVPANSIALVVRSSILDKVLPVARVPMEVTLNQDMRALTPNTDILPSYLAHLFRSLGPAMLRFARKTGGSVASIEVPKLMRYEVPIPDMEEQERIVSILDRFEALIHDLTSGLPAELNARRQQYEYYRDRLLTFQEAT